MIPKTIFTILINLFLTQLHNGNEERAMKRSIRFLGILFIVTLVGGSSTSAQQAGRGAGAVGIPTENFAFAALSPTPGTNFDSENTESKACCNADCCSENCSKETRCKGKCGKPDCCKADSREANRDSSGCCKTEGHTMKSDSTQQSGMAMKQGSVKHAKDCCGKGMIEKKSGHCGGKTKTQKSPESKKADK